MEPCVENMYVCHKTLWRVRRCGLSRAFVLSFEYKEELNSMSNWLGFLHVWKVVWHEVVDFEPVLCHHIWSEKGADDSDLSWNMNQLCGKETSNGHQQASSTSNLRCKTICMLMSKDGRNFWMFWVLKHQTSSDIIVSEELAVKVMRWKQGMLSETVQIAQIAPMPTSWEVSYCPCNLLAII
jgi:hypothetical protein